MELDIMNTCCMGIMASLAECRDSCSIEETTRKGEVKGEGKGEVTGSQHPEMPYIHIHIHTNNARRYGGTFSTPVMRLTSRSDSTD
jgi:hypothetical protein